MEILTIVIATVAGLGVGAGGIFAYNKKKENGGKNKADDLIRKAKHEAGDIVLEAHHFQVSTRRIRAPQGMEAHRKPPDGTRNRPRQQTR